MGVGSTLKSPVWMITPSGVVMASATQLTSECVTWMNSIEKRPQFQTVAGLDRVELGVIDHPMLFQTPLHQRQREGGAVHRHGDLLQQKRYAADVIFVAVRQDQAADVGRVLLQIREIGRDDVDAQQLVVREHHPGVHDDDVVAVADGHGVHAELAQAAERDDLQFLIGHARISSVTTFAAHNAAGREFCFFT